MRLRKVNSGDGIPPWIYAREDGWTLRNLDFNLHYINEANPLIGSELSKANASVVAFSVEAEFGAFDAFDVSSEVLKEKLSAIAHSATKEIGGRIFLISTGNSYIGSLLSETAIQRPSMYLGHLGGHEGGFSFYFPWRQTYVKDFEHEIAPMVTTILRHIATSI